MSWTLFLTIMLQFIFVVIVIGTIIFITAAAVSAVRGQKGTHRGEG